MRLSKKLQERIQREFSDGSPSDLLRALQGELNDQDIALLSWLVDGRSTAIDEFVLRGMPAEYRMGKTRQGRLHQEVTLKLRKMSHKLGK